jgi:Ca2+-binding RTX toxin-like protein
VRDFSATAAGYFSANGGSTSLGAFNTVSGGDAGDWASSVTNDSFDAFSGSSVVNAISANDLSVVDVLGWNQAPAASSAGTAMPTGISIAAATSGLNSAEASPGLAAKAAVATVGQLGGALADTFTYALGGTNASSFTLVTSASTAALAVGSSALAGALGGRLYSLTLTPTDKSSGLTGPAGTIGVVVVSSAGDTVNVATLAQALGTSTPTFVYGLAGSDTLNGAGMTGNLFITGGAGADIMTGGSGVNDYLFGSAADSTSKGLDIITNFKVASDVIDFTALGTNLTYAGQIASGAKLSGDSIGWQQSGGNTLVYVNTAGAARSLAAAGMEIKLTGLLVPTISNFAHA